MRWLPVLWPRHASSDEDVSVYVLTSSCQMIAVCLAVIGILSTDPILRKTVLMRDHLLAVDTLLFLLSTFCAYIAMRERKQKRLHRIELFAEWTFLSGMMLMVLICISLAMKVV